MASKDMHTTNEVNKNSENKIAGALQEQVQSLILSDTDSSLTRRVKPPDIGTITKTKQDDETLLEAIDNQQFVKIKMESDPRAEQTLEVLFANFDQTVDTDGVEMLIKRAKENCQQLNFELTILENCFIQEMEQKVDELNEKYRKGQKYHFAIFAVHTYESRLNINEKTAGIGYFAFYEALKQITGDRVIVLFGGDTSNENKVISSVVMSKICTQFSPEYINGNKGLLMSWNSLPLEIHCYALFRFLRLVDVCIIDVSSTDWNSKSLFDVKDEDERQFECMYYKLNCDMEFSLPDKATIMKAFSTYTGTIVSNPVILIAVDIENMEQEKTQENISCLLQMFSDTNDSVVVVHGDKMEIGDDLSSKKSRIYMETTLEKADFVQMPLIMSCYTVPSDEQRNALKRWFFELELDRTRFISRKTINKYVDNELFPRQIGETESVTSNTICSNNHQSNNEDGNQENGESWSRPSYDNVIKNNLLVYEENLKQQQSPLSVVCAFMFCTQQGELIGDVIDKLGSNENYSPEKYEKDIAKRRALKSTKKGIICIVLLKGQEDDVRSCVVLEEELEKFDQKRKVGCNCILS